MATRTRTANEIHDHRCFNRFIFRRYREEIQRCASAASELTQRSAHIQQPPLSTESAANACSARSRSVLFEICDHVTAIEIQPIYSYPKRGANNNAHGRYCA